MPHGCLAAGRARLLTPGALGRDNALCLLDDNGPSIDLSWRIAAAMPVTIEPGTPARQVPDSLGRFGAFGGRFVPETLMDSVNRLAEEYSRARQDPAFQAELDYYLTHYVGRPS